MKRLAGEEGFSVKDWRTGEIMVIEDDDACKAYVESLIDRESNENIHNRACHNLWTYNFEVRQYRSALAEGRLESFVASRLRDTRYASALSFIQIKHRRIHRILPIKDLKATG